MTDTPYDAAMTRNKQELARQLVDANARIEALEAALREIAETASYLDIATDIEKVARAALAPEPEEMNEAELGFELKMALERIEALEAALRKIAETSYMQDQALSDIVTAALAPEPEK